MFHPPVTGVILEARTINVLKLLKWNMTEFVMPLRYIEDMKHTEQFG